MQKTSTENPDDVSALNATVHIRQRELRPAPCSFFCLSLGLFDLCRRIGRCCVADDLDQTLTNELLREHFTIP